MTPAKTLILTILLSALGFALGVPALIESQLAQVEWQGSKND